MKDNKTHSFCGQQGTTHMNVYGIKGKLIYRKKKKENWFTGEKKKKKENKIICSVFD